jgi:uncharacterized RDD family membrane protein YckC
MSEIDGASGASANCWNCEQPLKPGAEVCVFCGVAQRRDEPAQYLVAPTGADSDPSPVHTWIPTPPPVAPGRRVASEVALDPVFAGTAATTGAQVLAFSIDVVVVVAVAVVVWLLTGELVFAALAVLEMAIGLWVLEARTGATFGNAILRLRASRDDAPFSPGIGPALVRRLVTGVGFLAAGVGAWVVVASGAWDKKGRGRSWADIAAHTLVVSVPPKVKTPSIRIAPAAVVDSPVALAAPQVVSTLARQHSVEEDSVSQSKTGAPGAAFASAPVTAPAAEPIDVAPASAALPENADGTILLVFDTGQREQFATPVAVNLGRNPVSTEPNDKLVTVGDPDQTVSKTHLRLEHSRGRTWVTDGGSTNGTDLLDDEGGVTTLAAGDRVLLDEGVRVRIGNRAFTISLILGGEK